MTYISITIAADTSGVLSPPILADTKPYRVSQKSGYPIWVSRPASDTADRFIRRSHMDDI